MSAASKKPTQIRIQGEKKRKFAFATVFALTPSKTKSDT